MRLFDRRPARRRTIQIPKSVWTQASYESLMRQEPVEETVPRLIWLALWIVGRQRDGWKIVFERGEEREVLRAMEKW